MFDHQKSTFQSHDQLQRDSLLAASMEYMGSGNSHMLEENFRKNIRNQYIIQTDIDTSTLHFTEILGNQLSASYSENNTINWKLENEKREIRNISCQKATTTYGGRKWSAWFAPEYNFSFGPYTFFGLPGLIIKLSDSDGNFNWELNGIKTYDSAALYEKNDLELQSFPTTKLDKQKFLKLKKQYLEQPLETSVNFFQMHRVKNLKIYWRQKESNLKSIATTTIPLNCKRSRSIVYYRDEF
ncbi:GLPGLI family protein [Chryseobacterium salipaludis]|nr:GLPGLI family protein [Chryseobacterium salipaludis]